MNNQFQDNKFYLNNPSLPTIHSKFEYTKEMLEDIQKCQKNIVYFAEKFFTIVEPEKGKQVIKLYKAQKRILKSFQKNNKVVLCASRQVGKALDEDTPIPTPFGFKRMGDLKDGDKVYDENGNICTVLKAHDTLYDRNCYKVIFDNGESIIADEEHLWFTQTQNERNKNKLGSVKTTKQILSSLLKHNSKEPNHRIKKCDGVAGIEKELSIDPYLLGVWLGDGYSNGARISVGKQDIDEFLSILAPKNYSLKTDKRDGNFRLGINGKGRKDKFSLKVKLNELNLIKNKHIPENYLQASKRQRTELLMGIMDTDGHIRKNGTCEIGLSNPVLADNVNKLILSLGYKTYISIKKLSIKNKNHADSTVIFFTPNDIVFKLKRKKDRQIAKCEGRINYHYIKNVVKVDSVPVRCITVDSPNNLYLCGNSYIPTHNTTLTSIFALYITCFYNDKSVLIVANKEKTAKEILQRIRTAYELLPNWLKPAVDDYSKTKVKFANGSMIDISTTASTAARGSTCNVLIIDEAAHILPHLMEEFFKSVIPIVSSAGKSAKIFMLSTPNGTLDQFYKIYSGAEKGENGWKAERIDWWEFPGHDEEWKAGQIGALGSIESFNQEFGNCVAGNTVITLKNKETGDILDIPIEQLYNILD